MNHLELFSGTHSFGKVSSNLGYNVISLDRDLGAECPFTDYVSQTHIQEDIMTWDYTIYPPNHFKLITASPVCMWWSMLRNSWIGRKIKAHGDTIITKEILQNDIDLYGKPMVDKVFEIIDYFNPQYFIIENPKTGRMKEYINELIPYYDVDYCKYSNWGYKKTTRFWTNIEGFNPKTCKNDCDNMGFSNNNQNLHKTNMACSNVIFIDNKCIRLFTKALRIKYKKELQEQKKTKHNKKINDIGGGSNRLERYRIPALLIEELLNKTIL